MRIIGIDGGIASIGWAVIQDETSILGAGVRTFDPPETDKERTPTNTIRRQKRGQRRVIRRRRQRMAQLRTLFAASGLLASATRDVLRQPGLDPWQLRADGLQRQLTGAELAVALGHIARHRGFRSNSKRDRGSNAASDTSKMLKVIDATRDRLQGRTIGQMFIAEFPNRKRNRDGDFSRSVLRRDLENEVRLLFSAQRRLGQKLASEALEERFASIAFTQRPLQDSESLLGNCPFEPDQKRTSRRSPAFELFRLLSRLNAIALTTGGQEWRLTPDQVAVVSADFGKQKKITYRSLRKSLDLDPRTRFAGVKDEDETRDVVARSGNAAEGTATLRGLLPGAAWEALQQTPDKLDRIAEVLTFRDDPDSIHLGLSEADVDPLILAAILQGVGDGKFANFTGAGHISAKAARRIIPHLARGLVYSEACAEAGYDHTARPEVRIKDVRNPVARKALSEMLKQVRAIVQAYGVPDRIHVELARDIGKGAEERDEITRGIDRRNKEKERVREQLRELLHVEPTGEDLLRFELWNEQNGRCLYSDEAIPCEAIVASNNSVQVDHILPWSRFGDDSFYNKTLCTAAANQAKKGRTPFEWFDQEKTQAAWAEFTARVEGCKGMKGRKKRGCYLRRNAAEVEEGFRNRNLGDTRYATRLFLDLLKRRYPDVLVLARPGALTAKLRRAWGIDDLKKDQAGKRREDDRHHALDAIVLAATSQSMLARLTTAAQRAERSGAPRGFDFAEVREPWEGFRDQARAAVAGVFVSRAERHRARGEAHAATIRQVRERDGKLVVFERKPIDALKLADLERVKDAERNGAIIASLRAWIEAGKPKEAPPRSPKGDAIRKVRLATDGKPAVEVRFGTADRGEMARVDVFAQVDRRGRRQFLLVPIYPHQVADRTNFPRPPCRAVVAYKDEVDWTPIADNAFLFTLHANSLLEVTKPDGEIITGYFKGLHRGTGAIAMAPHHNQRDIRGGIGAKTLLSIRKFHIDRLGCAHEVARETRTWHGVACT
jgi:CRISPR-associated endonuclease Csn1